jgi:hypothetical protein
MYVTNHFGFILPPWFSGTRMHLALSVCTDGAEASCFDVVPY